MPDGHCVLQPPQLRTSIVVSIQASPQQEPAQFCGLSGQMRWEEKSGVLGPAEVAQALRSAHHTAHNTTTARDLHAELTATTLPLSTLAADTGFRY